MRNIENIPVDDLKPNELNARIHSANQVASIAESIRAFGFNSPVLVGGDNIIIAGHGRVQAARSIGMATVPCLRIDHLSPAELRAYMIADNRLAQLASWDNDILAKELEFLKGADISLPSIGFPDEDFAKAIQSSEIEFPREPHAQAADAHLEEEEEPQEELEDDNDYGSDTDLKAPFPWFGGKRRVSKIVWARFGEVANYVEPFAGSLAVLLGRPGEPTIETINDLDGFVANFWRSIKLSPAETAQHCDWPVNENDLIARHLWLVNERERLTKKLNGKPDYHDAKIAGWWVWGICAWIGGGWCNEKNISRHIPHLGDAGQGVNRKLNESVSDWFSKLSQRLRRARICSGDWSRVCTKAITFRHGLTGVFLDPPYADNGDRSMGVYANDDGELSKDVRKWAIENGDNPLMRIALCGYEGEHEMPPSWSVVRWKAVGGYGIRADGRGRENASRERIWFSPHCLKP